MADTRATAIESRHRHANRCTIWGIVLVLVVYAWIISAGGVWPVPMYSHYYSRLADALERGQTALLVQPTAQHLALPDPYDPVANKPYRGRIHDMVLFEGKLYLYWGPVPATLLVPAKWITGKPFIGDEWLVIGFAVGIIVLTGLILRRIWGRFFADQPPWTLFMGIVVAGLATPMAYTLARPAVYEAAILGGQFFLMAGIYALFPVGFAVRTVRGNAGVSRPHNDGLHGGPYVSPGAWRLGLAGACFACAVGSRVSLAIAVIVLALLACGWIVRTGWRQHASAQVFRRLLAFGLPLVIGAGLLAYYNHARFGRWMEFGQKYQLTGANYNATPALFSVDNLWPGLWSYAARPVYVGPRFPFVFALPGQGTFPSFISLPRHYESHEPIAGILLVAPFVWLAVFAVAMLRRSVSATLQPRRGESSIAQGVSPGLPVEDPGSPEGAQEHGSARSHNRSFAPTGLLPGFDAFPGLAPWAMKLSPLRGCAETHSAGAGETPLTPALSPEYRGEGATEYRGEGDDLRRITLYLLVASLLGFAPILFMVGSTMRYLVDLAPCLFIVAMIGLWHRMRRGRSGRVVGIAVVLAAWSIIAGILLSFSGYYSHFLTWNRELCDALSYRTNALPAWYELQNSPSPPPPSE